MFTLAAVCPCQLVEAVSGTRGRAEHLLAQLRSAGHARALPAIKTAATASGPNRATVLDGVTAQIHDTIMSQAGAVPDNHPRYSHLLDAYRHLAPAPLHPP